MSKSTFNSGGQRRTLTAGCGWTCVGALREVDNKHKIHKKYCEKCKNKILPEFNKKMGLNNGWSLLRGNTVIKQTVPTYVMDNKEKKDREIELDKNNKNKN
jgi:hypothetical protein